MTKVYQFTSFTLLLILFLTNSLFAQNDFNVQYQLPSGNFYRLSVCGDAQSHTVRLENISGEKLEDVSVKLNLPNGLFYVPGTISGAATESTTLPPVFNAGDFDIGEVKTISFDMDVNCNGLSLALSSSSTNYSLDLCYTGGNTEQNNLGSPNFEVVNPVLSFPKVVGNTSSNNLFDASFGLEDTLKVDVVNGGEGSLREFTYCVINNHPYIKLNKIVVSGVDVPVAYTSATGDRVYFTINEDEIANAQIFAGNPIQESDLFQFNEKLVVCEVWETVSCPAAGALIPDIERTAYYGCDGVEICQQTPNSFTGVRFGILGPQIQVSEYYHHFDFDVDYKDRPYYSDCYADGENLTYTFAVINRGVANMKLKEFDLSSHAHNYYYMPFSIDETSVKMYFKDGVTTIAISPPSPTNVVELGDLLSPTHGYITNCHDGDATSVWRLEYRDQNLIVPPGDTLMIEYGLNSDEENCGTCSAVYHQFSLPYPQMQKIEYSDECDIFEFSTVNSGVAPRLREYIRTFSEGTNNFFSGSVNTTCWNVTQGENYFINYYCPNNGQPQVGSSYDDNRYHINSPNAYIEDWYVLPEGLDWVGISGDINTSGILWTDATGDSYPIYQLDYTDNDCGSDTLKVRYQGSQNVCFDLRQSKFSLQTTPDCGEAKEAFCSKAINISKHTFYVTECGDDNSKCFEEIDAVRSHPATIHGCECNPCEGMVFTYLDLSRQTFGDNDPDNDGIIEPGDLDLNTVNKGRFITGDTIRATYGGWVNLITKPNFEYAYATINVPIIGSGVNALGDSGITPLSARVQIWDQSNGGFYECDLVQLFPDGQKVVANLSVQSLKDLGCSGMPLDFVYEQGDSISVDFDFRLKDYINSQQNVNFGSEYYMTDQGYDSGTHYQCNTLSQTMTYIPYAAYNEWVYREIGGCNDGMDNNYNGDSYGSIASVYDSHRNLFRLGSTGFDYFPNEVRQIAKITQQTYVNNSDLKWGDQFKMLIYDNNGSLTETGGSLGWQRYTLDMTTSSCFAISDNTIVVDFECVYAEVGYERFDEGMDIYCAPTMSPTCNSEIEDGGSFKDVKVYTEYDMLESMFCSPTWTAIDSSIGVNDNMIDPFNASLVPHFMNYRSSIYGGDFIKLTELPKIALQPHSVNQTLYEEEACFNVDVSNIGSGPAQNVFFTLENISGGIIFQGVNDLTNNTMLPINLGVVNLGSLGVGEIRELEFCVTSNNCSRDSIQINTGWDCDGLPSSPKEANCTSPVSVFLEVPNAELGMIINSPDPTVPHVTDLCEEVEYVVQLSSSDIGSLHDINFQFNIPSGMEFVPGSFELAYPVPATGSPTFIPTTNQPTNTSGSQYNIVLDPENALLAENGLPGTTDIGNNFLLVRFRTFIGCGSFSGSRVRFLSWAYDPCDSFANYRFSPGPAIKINGVSDSYVSNLSVPDDEKLNACQGNNIELGVNFSLAIGSLPVGATDSVMVELPYGINYVTNSYSPNLNSEPASASNPRVETSSGSQTVFFDLLDGVMEGQTIDFTFEVEAVDVGQACREYEMIIRTFNSQVVYCESRDEFCDVKTTSDEVSAKIEIVKPDLNLSNLEISSCTAPPDMESLSYCYDISNSGTDIDDGTITVIEFYNDANNNGDFDNGVDDLLSSVTTTEAIASGSTINVCGTTLVPSGMTCNVIAVINPDATCACAINTSFRAHAVLDQKIANKNFVACSNDVITGIGPMALDNVSYEWVGINGASTVGISNTMTTPINYQFQNTTGSTLTWEYYLRSISNEECATLDTFQIIIYPEEHGEVSLQACPFDEFNLAGPEGNTNYQWTPSLGLTDDNAANTNVDASLYPQGVHEFVLTYTDVNGCPGDYTAEVTVVPCALTYVGNYVWCDDNNNGIQDDDPIEGITVQLFGSTDPTMPIATTVTDADGAYLFGPIPQGEYIIGVDLYSSNYQVAMKDATTDDMDNDLNSNFQTDAFYLSNGDSLTTIDLGLLCPLVDLELEKTALTDKTTGLLEALALGDTVYWNIKVCNRMMAPDTVNFAADSIEITEILPTGITYLSHTTSLGTYDPVTGLWNIDRINNGNCPVLCIESSITQDLLPITNTSEITKAADPDIDSTPDNDDGDQSEDDEDNATIYPKRMDLSLTKRIASTQSLPVESGDDVSFTIEVCNQGNVPAYNIDLVDYIPTGMNLNDNDWTPGGLLTEAFITIPGPLALTACTTVDITLMIDPTFVGDTLTNFAEITSQEYDDGLFAPDVDSTSDDDPGNDGPVTDGQTDNLANDEDDHDPAGIHVTMIECAVANSGPVCPGASVTLMENGGDASSWNWSGPSGFSSSLQNPIVSPAISGMYSVTISDTNGFMEVCVTEVSLLPGIEINGTSSDVSCNGGSDGSIDINVSGGTAPYSYDWSNDGSEDPDNDNQDISNLSAGAYTVTVTDVLGCNSTAGFTVSEATVMSCTASSVAALCNGSATGSVTVTASGGTPSYEYSLNGGAYQPSGIFTGLASGMYNVIARDVNNCVSICSVIVTEPSAVSCTIVGINVSDCAIQDGSVTASVSGGTSPYTYQINGGASQSSNTFNGLMAGMHSVVVTDDNGCTSSCQITIAAPQAPVCQISSFNNVDCAGALSGSVTVTASGGTVPFEYSLDNITFQTSNAFTGLAAGVHMIYVRNTTSTMCVSMCSITLTEPTALVCQLDNTDVSCAGGSDATISVNADGGVTPYEYSLNGGAWQPGDNFASLNAGAYTVTVRDGNLCTSTCMIVVMEPSVLACNAIGTNALCNGTATGSVSVATTGGVAPYEYSINNGAWQTSNMFTMLAAGTYSMSSRDINGCVTSCNVSIAEPDVLSCMVIGTDLTDCILQDGEISLMVTGGTSPFMYRLNGGAAQGANQFVGLMAGMHTVEVIDAHNCSSFCTVTLSAPSTPMCSITAFDHVDCNGGDSGTITVAGSGGSSPYEYSLDNMVYQSSGFFNGLSAGVHMVYVRNASSPMCITMCGMELTEPTELVCNHVQTDVSCNGGADASININADGGVTPYEYSLNGSAWQPGFSFSGLSAGDYVIVVRDAHDCVESCMVTINQPSSLSCTLSSMDALCAGSDTGLIAVSATGGTGAYEYNVNNGPWQTSNQFSSLAAGSYTISVRDNNDCLSTCTAVIGEPGELSCSLVGTDVTNCELTDGRVTVMATSGTAPYTYSINGGASQASNEFAGLMAGTHTVLVTDDNGCESSCEIVLTAPTTPSCEISAFTHIACNGESTGSLTISATGGVSPYEYSIDNITFQSSNVFNGLSAGDHTVYVRNQNSPMCISMCSMELTEEILLICDNTTEQVSCLGGNDGSVTVNATGGVTPYEYSLNGGAWQPSNMFNTLSAGSYTLVTRDANDCTTSCNFSISEPALLSCTLSKTDALCNGSATGSVTSSATGGVAPYEYNIDSGAWQTSNVFSSLSAGTHTVTTRDDNGCLTACVITISEPATLNCTATGMDLSDCVLQDGEVSVTASGGTAPFTYRLDGGLAQSSNLFTGLMAGMHNVEVIDDNGCTSICQVTLVAPSAPTCSITTFTHVDCKFSSTGSITVQGSGGAAPYEYSLDNITYQSTGVFNGLAAGVHMIYVRNVSSPMCITMCGMELTEPNELVCDHVQTDVSCTGGSDGQINVNADGGVTPYEYSLNGGAWQPGFAFTGLSAGGHSVVVRDANDCLATCMITITEPTTLSCSIAGVDALCFGSATGIATVSATGGTGSYEYNINNGSWQSSNVFTLLSAGSYSVNVRDENDCVSTCAVVIGEPGQLTCSLVGTDVTDCGLIDGTITVTGMSGTAPYRYSINGGVSQASNIFEGLSSGAHTIMIVDDHGCESSCDIQLSAPTVPTCEISSFTHIACKDGATGSLTISATEGVTPYEYSIDNIDYQSSNTFSGLVAGDYTVYVRNVTSPMCVSTCGMELTEPTLLVCDYTTVDVSCFGGSDASVTVNATGGVTAYEYSLDGSPWQTSNMFSDLSAGSYDLVTRDANGCTASCDFTITEPSLLSCSLTKTDVLCNGDGSGSITASANGGVLPYVYSLEGSPWQSGNSFINVPGGDYIVSVRDAQGCISTCQITVVEPDEMMCVLDYILPESCAFNDGEISVEVQGGVLPYSFSIDGGLTFQPTMVFSNLSNGDYTILTIDGNGCEVECSFTVLPDCFDLALAKELVTDPPYVYGQLVSFDIAVTNEGNIDAYDIEITEHIPCGFSYDPTSLINLANDWTPLVTANPMSTIDKLVVGATKTLRIELTVEQCLTPGGYLNVSEISSTKDVNGDDIDDEDSTPDFDPDNDPESEDDHDTALLPIYDPALKKELITATPYNYGDDLLFEMVVCNQNANFITNVGIVDYLPAGYSFDASLNAGWTQGAANILAYTYSASVIQGGDCVRIPLTLTLEMAGGSEDWINISEIDQFTDENGNPQLDTDATNDRDDSNDGNMVDDEIDNTDGDEDDSDYAEVQIVDAALIKTTTSAGPYVYGDTSSFNIKVYNQGSVDLYNVSLDDVLPCGYNYLDANDGTWTYDSASHIATTTLAGPILAGDSLSVTIDLEIEQCHNLNAYQNIAEIQSFENMDGEDISSNDIDSNADSDATNDVVCNDKTDNTDGDEDDHDPEVIDIFDLALEKSLVTPLPYGIGDVLEFEFYITNEGNVAAQNIAVADHLPVGFSFDGGLNPGWDSASAPMYVNTITSLLQPGETDTISIFVTLEASFGGLEDYVNTAEIISADDDEGNPTKDADSDPDTDPDNDSEDEDDHDTEAVVLVDAALRKTIATAGPYEYGDVLTFDIEVINQGVVDLYEIKVNDFIPCGYEYLPSNDGVWAYDAVSGIAATTIAGPIAGGTSDTVTIDLRLVSCAPSTPDAWTNVAEIQSFQNMDGEDITDEDVDSTADNDPSNDTTVDDDVENKDGDEDDNDPSSIEVFDLALEKSVDLPDPFVSLGDTIEYWISIYNQGNITAQKIGIVDYLAAPLVYDASLNTGWTLSGGNLEYTVDGPLSPGDTIHVALNLIIDPAAAGTLEALNFAEITSSLDNLGNDRSDDDIDSSADDNAFNDAGGVPGGPSDGMIMDNGFDADGDGVADEDDHDPVRLILLECHDLACIGDINLSLDDNCTSEITGAMLLEYAPNDPTLYEVVITDDDGNVVSNMFDHTQIGMCYDATVGLPDCGANTCWTRVCIEDKYAPKIDCGPTQEVFACSAPLADISAVTPPVITENCGGATLVLVNEVITLNDDCDPDDLLATVVRSYKAVDAQGNESSVCDQTIEIKRVAAGSVEFPSDFVSNVCTTSTDVSSTGVPTIGGVSIYPVNQSATCNLMVSFEDIPVGQDNCHNIFMRMWTVREWWCGGVTDPITFGQRIEINDLTAPTITCPADMTVTTEGGFDDCVATFMLPAATVSDDCNTPVEVDVETGVLFIDGNGGEVTLNVEDSPHTITYIAYDGCYNSSSCTMTVTVRDETQPTILCEQNTIASLQNTGTVEVFADVFDDGSFDDCGIDRFEVRRMEATVFGPSVNFDCADLGGDVMVVLRVYDTRGNYNECMVSVQVQDKNEAGINCLANVNLTCPATYDLNNLAGQFGMPTLSANCAGNLSITELAPVVNVSNCGTGNITRRFTASDGVGGTLTCTQIITIVNDDPVDVNDIVWPLDFNTTSMCDFADATPDNLPAVNSYPVITEDACDLVGIDFDDQEFTFANDPTACFKILRTWTVIDWCQRNADGTYITWTHVQELKINNDIDPTIDSGLTDVLVESTNVDCSSAFVTLGITASDDCVGNSPLSYTYQIDLNSDGTTDQTGMSNNASGTYPIGIHTIYWMVLDGCGNEAQGNHQFEVRNVKAPIAICYQGLSVNLTLMDTDGDNIPDTNMAFLWASDLDKGSTHPCGYDVSLSLSSDVDSTNVVFDCADLGQQGVQLWVTDSNGNQSFCSTFVIVQDNSNNCPQMNMMRVGGRIFTEDDENVEEVEVALDGSGEEDMTEDTGEYAFEDMPIGGAYTIDPYKNSDAMNGVSTLDLVLIQKHILQKQLLIGPYKHIAADVNHDERITAIDLIQLRKLILGIYEEFPENESWRFVDAMFEFPQGMDALDLAFPEKYVISDLSNNMWVNFIGVKIGDVNGSVQANWKDQTVVKRSGSSLNLRYTDQRVVVGEQVRLTLSSSNFEQISGLQMTLEHKGMTLIDVEAGELTVTNGNVGMIADAVTTFSWHSEGGKAESIVDGQELFTFIFEVNKDGRLADLLNVSSEQTIAEAYKEDAESTEVEVMPISLEAITTDADDQLEMVILYQNEPNPWKASTRILMDAQEDVQTELIIRDASNKVALIKEISLTKGMNIIELSGGELPSSGVYFYYLADGDSESTKTMIKIE